MSSAQYELLDKLIIRPLIDQNCRVFLFGSRAKGTHVKYSDVDILYRIPEGKKLPPGFLSQIKENIEESRFLFIVDLVNEAELAESYKPSVFATRVEIF